MTSDLFFFNDTATTEIYTLPYTTLFRSALQLGPHAQRLGQLDVGVGPVLDVEVVANQGAVGADDGSVAAQHRADGAGYEPVPDRKSTRLNSSHANISYAVFCLKKKQLLI